MIELAGVHKVYKTGKLEYPALRGIDLTIDDGDMVAIGNAPARSGLLRCVGARARDIRRIFATEGLVIAALGWLIGVGAGYVLAYGMVKLTESATKLDLTFTFPIGNLATTLIGTVILALLVLLAPLRRAVRFKPGQALRYA